MLDNESFQHSMNSDISAVFSLESLRIADILMIELAS